MAEKSEYVRYRLDQSRESLQAAEACLQSGYLRSAVNRVYYACFYAVSALLLAEGFRSAKHTGVRSLFDRHWIKNGRLPIEMAHFYRDLFKYRHQGDYEDLISFAHDEVESWFEEARNFVRRVSEEVDKLQ
ncbi:MAG TPA: HEPN domain-containing protein [Candidatus Hydrogenedentes bacterium]|nr:HEPN domain-containing protein [Candidatus Hydrogenedentota bacterium]